MRTTLKSYIEAISGFDFQVPDEMAQKLSDFAVQLFKQYQVTDKTITEDQFYNQLFPKAQAKLER